MNVELEEQYRTLTRGKGFCLLGHRTQIELTGSDRARFLHGLCTNDIQSLRPHEGCEAFLTNVQGKVEGYVYIYCHEECLVIDTVAGESETILKGLDRYLIREDVQLHDRTNEWLEFIVAGAECSSVLQSEFGWKMKSESAGILHSAFASQQGSIALRRVPFCGPGSFILSCEADAVDGCREQFRNAGFQECQPEAIDVTRIEAGTPLFGIDVTNGNLPQEIGRNEQAINFNKGCYLGQETVARLDALGHVNRQLVGLRFDGTEVPAAGTVLKQEGKPLARVTSACWSPSIDGPLALAFVRRGYIDPGSRIESERGAAVVVSLPVFPMA